MTFVPAGYVHVIATFQHTGFLRPAAVTWAANPSVTPSLGVLQDVVDDFFTQIAPRLDNAVNVGPCSGYFGSFSGETTPFTDTRARPGTRAIDSDPPNSAFLIRKETGRPGRKGRGRMFVPWALSSLNVDELGNVAVTETTGMGIQLTNWLSGAQAAGRPLVLLHTLQADIPDVITNLAPQPLIGTQRKRLRR